VGRNPYNKRSKTFLGGRGSKENKKRTKTSLSMPVVPAVLSFLVPRQIIRV